MKCRRAIVYYKNGQPESYSLIIEGMGTPGNSKSSVHREKTFKEAYDLFTAVRKNWNIDGTAKA